MLRQWLCVLMAGLLVEPCGLRGAEPPKAVKEQVQEIGANRAVEVRLLAGEKLRGWVGAVSESGFELRLGRERLESRQLGYGEVKTVKAVESVKPSHTGRNILIGVGIAVAAIGIGILIAAHKAEYL